MLIEKIKKFRFFYDLYLKNFFSAVDIFFANKINPKSEEEAIFLAYLFFISRNGFISLLIENDDVYPRPKDFNFDENIEIHNDLLINKVITGSKSYIKEDFENFPNHPVCKYQSYYYLQKNFVFETFIINNLCKLLLKKPDDILDKKFFFDILNKEKKLLLKQKEAIKNVFENTISFVLGGPGTGKTYLACHLINMFLLSFDKNKKKEIKIVATSFTGKATNHLKKVILENSPDIDVQAKTLHLLLDIKERKNKDFGNQKLDFDLIIVDEASMIDIRLFAYLLDAVKEGARIVFIGDPHQLPPIDGGNIFSELINQKIITTTYLDIPVRFENNFILNLANGIKEENITKLNSSLNEIEFLDLKNLGIIKNLIFQKARDCFFSSSDKKLDIESLLKKTNNFRILSSIKKGPLGVDVLNKEIFFSFYKETKTNPFLYIPIVITKNHYQLDLFNGDLGVLEYQVTNSKLLNGIAYFKSEKTIKKYPVYLIRSYEYAYVISIHKSQGSEFDSAILIIPDYSQNFGKELLYTAVTRVKNEIVLISSKELLLQLVKKSSFKKSALLNRLMIKYLVKTIT